MFSKQISFILATIVLSVAVAGLLVFYYRLPNVQGDVKGAKTLSQDQKQQLFEACLSSQLSPEDYIKYKTGDNSVLSASGEKIGFCYGVLAQ